jgi:thiol-disulfide isomerase/thioredoxin
MAQYKTFSTMGKDDNAPTPESMADVPRIGSSQERQALIQGNKVVVIDNYTDWCGPCKQCAPQFAVLAQKYVRPGLCALAKENVEDKHGGWPVAIRGVPCFHFYVNGHYQDEMTVAGADMGALEQTLQRLLA